eukprot:TRINITY_DN2154_c0_g1_i6.p1 TRINITY_DN2154_c0_g1~~TRINITY_DN2154_c0_g1_i6.p1  ORF type:complete len:246 (-),score=-21.16 TRINITY_DN2154_c0_g1_i6:241-978(-)
MLISWHSSTHSLNKELERTSRRTATSSLPQPQIKEECENAELDQRETEQRERREIKNRFLLFYSSPLLLFFSQSPSTQNKVLVPSCGKGSPTCKQNPSRRAQINGVCTNYYLAPSIYTFSFPQNKNKLKNFFQSKNKRLTTKARKENVQIAVCYSLLLLLFFFCIRLRISKLHVEPSIVAVCFFVVQFIVCSIVSFYRFLQMYSRHFFDAFFLFSDECSVALHRYDIHFHYIIIFFLSVVCYRFQ